MKKNNVMRVFALLLALTLISVCAISGTFAKYVTRAAGEDSARVAKWGVLLSVEGNAFATKYKTHETGDNKYPGEFSVIGENEAQVVAPGTSSKDLNQTLKATVTGKPEVAARYSIQGNVDDIVLKAGTYTDYTELVYDNATGTSAYSNTFTLEKDYSPVKWNMVISKGGTELNVADALYANLPDDLIERAEAYGLTPSGCSFFSAVQILKKVASSSVYKQVVENALGSIVSGGSNFQLEVDDDGIFTMSYDFDPNKEMDYTFTLSWEWKFEQSTVADELAIYDAADTYLGNVAAGVIVDDNANITIGAGLIATATQID